MSTSISGHVLDLVPEAWRVVLDGKRVAKIRKSADGYKFCFNGKSTHIYGSYEEVSQCIMTLIEEHPDFSHDEERNIT